MEPVSSQSAVRAAAAWEETIWFARLIQPTPRTSIAVPPPLADGGMIRRFLRGARARVASAGDPDAGDADYLLGELIGSGGMGVVYAASQVSLERTVAVKMLRSELVEDERSRDAFFTEAMVSAELDHPNTVPVYEIGLTKQGSPFYAMKRVRGEKWSSCLPANSLKQNLNILLMVSDVVAFAHDKGIIHRDLKPENVMLGPYGEVLLMDWGLAASVGSPRARRLSLETICAGTPAYMAPEVADCRLEKIGTASDIYLLGGTLYEIVTGLLPHGGEAVIDCIMAARKNELQPTEKSGELLDIALRALHFEPGERYPSVQEFAAAIRDALNHIDSFAYFEQGRRRFEDLLGLDREELYHECHEIVALYQRALANWPGNVRAAEGLVRVRETLAVLALRRGEIQLARSQVRAMDQECEHYHIRTLAPDSVADQVRASVSERGRKQVSEA